MVLREICVSVFSDLDYTSKNLFKYKNHLTKDEIEFIDKELENFI